MMDTLFFGGIAAAVIALNGCDFTTGLAVVGAVALGCLFSRLIDVLEGKR